MSIRIKNKLHNKYLKTKSTYYHSKFKYYRNKLNHLLKVSKRRYYNEYFLVNVNDSKRIWNGIKQIVHFKPKTSQKIIKIVKNNIEVNDPETIADAFNTYFANVGTNFIFYNVKIVFKKWKIKSCCCCRFPAFVVSLDSTPPYFFFYR